MCFITLFFFFFFSPFFLSFFQVLLQILPCFFTLDKKFPEWPEYISLHCFRLLAFILDFSAGHVLLRSFFKYRFSPQGRAGSARCAPARRAPRVKCTLARSSRRSGSRSGAARSWSTRRSRYSKRNSPEQHEQPCHGSHLTCLDSQIRRAKIF